MNFGSHHLHARRRGTKGFTPYPAPRGLRRVLDRVMLLIGPLAPLALLPQVIEIYATRDAGTFSLLTWSILACINTLWTLYGISHRELPIMLANAGLAMLNVAIVIGILLF